MLALNVRKYEMMLIQQLSGGNRRKVSLIVALLGAPPTMYVYVMNYELWFMFMLIFRGLLLYTGCVLFHVECCIRKPWSSFIIFYNKLALQNTRHHTNNN